MEQKMDSNHNDNTTEKFISIIAEMNDKQFRRLQCLLATQIINLRPLSEECDIAPKIEKKLEETIKTIKKARG